MSAYADTIIDAIVKKNQLETPSFRDQAPVFAYSLNCYEGAEFQKRFIIVSQYFHKGFPRKSIELIPSLLNVLTETLGLCQVKNVFTVEIAEQFCVLLGALVKQASLNYKNTIFDSDYLIDTTDEVQDCGAKITLFV